MRAAVLHRAKDLRLEHLPNPRPVAGEVLVHIKAVGVCGSDVHFWRDGRIGETVVNNPVILGHEAAGVIEQIGPEVTGLEPGMPVALEPGIPCGRCETCQTGNYNTCPSVRFFGTYPVDGCYRELVSHPAEFVFPLPQNVSLEEGAMLEPLAVAIHAVDLGKLKLASSVAVLGTGSIGLSVIQLARIAGTAKIYATDLLDERLEVARRLGADQVFNARNQNPVPQIIEATKGRGVDVVFEAAGAPETPDQCMKLARPCGTVVLIGICPEDHTFFQASPARRKGLTIRLVRRLKNTYPRAIRLVEKKMVDVSSLVTHRFPLEQTEKAFQLVDKYDDGVIKALIEI